MLVLAMQFSRSRKGPMPTLRWAAGAFKAKETMSVDQTPRGLVTNVCQLVVQAPAALQPHSSEYGVALIGYLNSLERR